jgi:hypothetical protein
VSILEPPHEPRSQERAYHAYRNDYGSRYIVILNIVDEVDVIAESEEERDQKDRADESAQLGHVSRIRRLDGRGKSAEGGAGGPLTPPRMGVRGGGRSSDSLLGSVFVDRTLASPVLGNVP